MRFRLGKLDVGVGNLYHRVGPLWVRDGLHVWWGDEGVHFYWRKSEHEPRRVIRARASDPARR